MLYTRNQTRRLPRWLAALKVYDTLLASIVCNAWPRSIAGDKLQSQQRTRWRRMKDGCYGDTWSPSHQALIQKGSFFSSFKNFFTNHWFSQVFFVYSILGGELVVYHPSALLCLESRASSSFNRALTC